MEIYSAILGVMADVGAIGKDKKNQQQGFKYRGIDDVMNALQPAMVKHGIFVAPTIIEQKREERQANKGGNLIYSICTIKYTFYAKDGSNVDVTVIGEGMDSGDKATNKAMSIAFKYACFQVFCIPTEEMKDPDAETPPPSDPVKAKQDRLKSKLSTTDRKEFATRLSEKFGAENAPAELKRLTGHDKTADVTYAEYEFALTLIAREEKRIEEANGSQVPPSENS